MENKSCLFRWTALVLGFTTLWLTSQFLAPLGLKYIPGMARLQFVNEAKNIDPGVFWYTNLEPSGEAIVFTTSSTDPSLSGGRL